MTTFAALFTLAAALAALATPPVARLAHRLGTLDHPSERKSHVRSMPRIGGVVLFAAWAGTLAIAFTVGAWRTALHLNPEALAAIVGGGFLVFAIGLWDDVRSLAPGPKILCEAMAAALVIGTGIVITRLTIAGVTIPLGALSIALTVLWIVGITNAFNLLDGLDGLATGLSIIAGATCAAIVIVRGERATAAVLVALVGALVGFLPFNFHPATIFLGDSGSLLAGFVLAVTAITGWQKGATALAVGIPLLIFALPILDTAGAVVRRLVRSEGEPSANSLLSRLARPDREHIHHVLMTLGLSHRAAVLMLYAIALCLSAVALLTMERP